MGVKAFISTKPYPGYANISLLKNTDEFVTGFVTYRLCKVLSEWLPGSAEPLLHKRSGADGARSPRHAQTAGKKKGGAQAPQNEKTEQ